MMCRRTEPPIGARKIEPDRGIWRVKPGTVDVDSGSVADQGSLKVTWISYVLPWVNLHVVVDGADLGRVGFRKPAAVDLAVGAHQVLLLGHRGYASLPVAVEIPANGGVELFGGNRRMPPGMQDYGEIKAWAKESSIWLGTERSAPPTASTAIPGDSHASNTMHSGSWYGRRRRIPLFVAAVLFWSIAAVRTPHVWSRIIDVVLILAAVHRSYVYWTDPLPPGYAERPQKQPRFGTKLWHKLAIAFLAAFALLVVAVSVWPAK